jgi:hypothetical protein
VGTIIPASDEDLLRGATVRFAARRSPVAIASAPAPTIFLFLHVHTPIRFDMLAANLPLPAADLALTNPHAARTRGRSRVLIIATPSEVNACGLGRRVEAEERHRAVLLASPVGCSTGPDRRRRRAFASGCPGSPRVR